MACGRQPAGRSEATANHGGSHATASVGTRWLHREHRLGWGARKRSPENSSRPTPTTFSLSKAIVRPSTRRSKASSMPNSTVSSRALRHPNHPRRSCKPPPIFHFGNRRQRPRAIGNPTLFPKRRHRLVRRRQPMGRSAKRRNGRIQPRNQRSNQHRKTLLPEQPAPRRRTLRSSRPRTLGRGKLLPLGVGRHPARRWFPRFEPLMPPKISPPCAA